MREHIHTIREELALGLTSLISNLKEFNFITVALTTKPFPKTLYPNLPNLRYVMNIPLWGTEHLGEHLKEFTIRRLIKLSAWTHEDDIRENFTPYFRTFLREAKLGGRDPEAVGEALVKMHKFLLNHSFRKTFKSIHVWKAFHEEIIEDELYSNARVSYMLKLNHVIRYLFRILAYDYPEANLYHSSASGLCGLIDVIKKLESGIPYIVTEHGVYFRERLLEIYPELNLPEKIFWLSVAPLYSFRKYFALASSYIVSLLFIGVMYRIVEAKLSLHLIHVYGIMLGAFFAIMYSTSMLYIRYKILGVTSEPTIGPKPSFIIYSGLSYSLIGVYISYSCLWIGFWSGR